MLRDKEAMTADKGHLSVRPWKVEVTADSNGEEDENQAGKEGCRQDAN